jgi:hypothetical protein
VKYSLESYAAAEYVGTFYGFGINGSGTITYGDGSIYEGSFADWWEEGYGAKAYGPGSITYPDGAKDIGQWRDGGWYSDLPNFQRN